METPNLCKCKWDEYIHRITLSCTECNLYVIVSKWQLYFWKIYQITLWWKNWTIFQVLAFVIKSQIWDKFSPFTHHARTTFVCRFLNFCKISGILFCCNLTVTSFKLISVVLCVTTQNIVLKIFQWCNKSAPCYDS